MSDMERDILEADIVCVGGGVASLTTALRFLKRIEQDPSCADREPPSVLVLEKGAQPGSHVLSGAVIDPAPFRKLLSSDEFAKLPIMATVEKEQFSYLSANHTFNLPITPPPMKAKGFSIASLSQLTRTLSELCEAAGAEVYPEMPVTEYIEKDGRVTGVLLGDKGVDKHGVKKANFEPGAEIQAKATILGEGAYGVVSQQLIRNRKLNARANHQAYALGIKEIFEVPSTTPGHIRHTFGYPLSYTTYGGGFVYCMDETHVAIGLVIALDYRNPEVNVHELFRAYKAHPAINAFITAGKPIGYGAKILPEGGLFSLPDLVTDGALLVGDSAGLLDAVRLKGVHLAVESGIAAGDALFDCWKHDDWSTTRLQHYPDALKKTAAWKKMRTFRNARQWFDYGLLPGMAAVGAGYVTGGLLPPGRMKKQDDYPLNRHCTGKPQKLPTLTRNIEKEHKLDIMSDLYLSGTEHAEDQPCHLIINNPEQCKECIRLYNAPCTRFCPAQVYELPEKTDRIQIQPSNCLHCKTCTIKCTYQNIDWLLPEGGGGPRYKQM